MRPLEKIRMRLRYGITFFRVVPILRELRESGVEIDANEETAHMVLDRLVLGQPQAFTAETDWASLIALLLEFLIQFLPIIFSL